MSLDNTHYAGGDSNHNIDDLDRAPKKTDTNLPTSYFTVYILYFRFDMAVVGIQPPPTDTMEGIDVVPEPDEPPKPKCETLYVQNLNEKIKIDGNMQFPSCQGLDY